MFPSPQSLPANTFNALFILLTRLATCMQCVLNEKKVSKYTPSNFELRMRGRSESSIVNSDTYCSIWRFPLIIACRDITRQL